MTGEYTDRIPAMIFTDSVTLDEYSSLLDELVAGRQRVYVKGVVKPDC